MPDTAPDFSIIMPVWNRRAAVQRAIDSCLAQDFAAFEVLVVDDGSVDGTPDAVASYADPRVRLIRHETNRGVCPARNTAVRASLGEWLIFLDSDHEMLPGCLATIRQCLDTDNCGYRLGFQYLFDDGRVSPTPMPEEPVVGYTEWLRWIDGALWTDALWVTPRHCFEYCMLPDSFALEFSYFLDFAKRFPSRMIPTVLAFQHTDSPDRLSYLAPPADSEISKRKARDQALDWQYVLKKHGGPLRESAPRRYESVLRNAAIASGLSGDRRTAVNRSIEALRFRPLSPHAWVTFFLVVAGRQATLLVNRIRADSRRRGSRRTVNGATSIDLYQSRDAHVTT